MKLLVNSNSIHRVKRKIVFKPMKFIKVVFYFILVALVFGFFYENASYNNAEKQLKTKSYYYTVNGTKLYYTFSGKGEYTLVFESDIGYTSFEWLKVIDKMPENISVKTFRYDRAGYGYSDKGNYKSPEEQAKDLHWLLKKAGASAPYILVGDGYGSLVVSSFAKQYEDEVAGIIFINPINEDMLKNSSYSRKIARENIINKIQKTGAFFGLTRLFDSLGLVSYADGLLEGIPEDYAKDIMVHRISKGFTNAIYNENKVLADGNSSSQVEGLIGDKPLAILINEKEDIELQRDLLKLTDGGKTLVSSVKPEKDVIPLENYSDIHETIRFIIKANMK